MAELLSKEDFRKVFFSKDIEDALGAFYQVDRSKVADYITPAEFQTFFKKASIEPYYAHDKNYYQAKMIIEKLPEENKQEFHAAYIAGARAAYDELVAAKDYQGLIGYLFNFRGDGAGFTSSTKLVDEVFTKEDIVAMSKLFRDMEENNESDPNFFTYGSFCLNMSKSYGEADPFQNLRGAVPEEDFEACLPLAHWEDRQYMIRLAVFAPKFESLISEEAFVDILRDSMDCQMDRGSDFWTILQANDHYASLFQKHAPVIFTNVLNDAIERKSFHSAVTIVETFTSKELLDKVCTPAQMTLLASVVAEEAGREADFSRIFTKAVKNETYKECFTADQIAAIAEGLTTFPPKEDFRAGSRSAHNEYDFDFGEKIDRNVSAFGELVTSAVEQSLADGIAADAFNRASIVYECGNNMNAVWDVERASKLRPDFRAAFVQGRLDIQNPRRGYAGVIGYDLNKDKFIFAPKVA